MGELKINQLTITPEKKLGNSFKLVPQAVPVTKRKGLLAAINALRLSNDIEGARPVDRLNVVGNFISHLAKNYIINDDQIIILSQSSPESILRIADSVQNHVIDLERSLNNEA